MSEELGRLTYFDVEKMGIYGCNGGDIDPRYTPNYFLSELISWVNANRFENTLPTKDDTRLRKKFIVGMPINAPLQVIISLSYGSPRKMAMATYWELTLIAQLIVIQIP
ncbi:hypothetical protein [Providencia stuartii]|uniref:Uncharacterized protein n=1 Tax=Providencia stuartii (strain MRSN 2154) TaxID=1157951 RepID=A0A140NJJ5_PROSM|nr:hypothetical protein [Providencia stuartii]AFH92807.1 hypothetical protein S70_04635 [Providencia stuartii MRSN 2154]